MTLKKAALTVLDYLSDLFTVELEQKTVTPTKEPFGMRVQQSLTTFLKQMVTTGYRERTMAGRLRTSH